MTQRLLTLAAASTALLATLQPAWPQSADPAIEEIQVTATRRPVAAGQVAAALTIIPAEDLRGVKLTTDALAGQAGVFLQQTTPGQGAAIVRGLKGSEVLQLVDGMRLNNTIFRNAPTQYLALVSPVTVERIEVLRGSPASLYGSDAVGGVVQVVSRMPHFEGREVATRGEFGVAFDSAEQQQSTFAAFDVGNERLAGLVAANYLDTGDRKVGGGERVGPSAYSARSFRTAAVYTPDDRSSWLIDLHYGTQPKTPRVDELVPGFGATEAASEEFFFAPNERSFLHLRHARREGWLGADWAVDFAWQEIVDDRISRGAGSVIRRLEDNASNLFGLSVTASGDHAAGGWVVGAEVYDDDVSSRRVEVDLDTGVIETVESRFPDGSTSRQAAIFANGDMALGERHLVNGGLRFSAVDVDLAETSLSPSTSVALEDVSADLGWQVLVTDETRVVADLSWGFRAPNVFDLGTLGERPGNRFNIPNASLESEKIFQGDLGVRHLGPAFSGELVAWAIDYDDRITSVLTGETTADGREIVQTQNRASARLWGLEASAEWRLAESVDARAVLNYTRGEQDDADGITEPGDRIPPLNGRLSLRVRAGPDWTLEPFVVFAATQDRLSSRDIRDSRIDPDGTDGWVTANLRADWTPADRWSLRLAATNLFDERYRVHGSGIDATGRNFFLGMSYRW